MALDEDTALPTLAVGVYLNMSHLVALVSQYIVAHLREQDVAVAVESAAQLHAFASEHGLDALGRFCAAFLSVHITEARNAPSYKLLGAKELDEVCLAVHVHTPDSHCCSQYIVWPHGCVLPASCRHSCAQIYLLWAPCISFLNVRCASSGHC